MKCHQCNQNSIKIKTNHIYCDICGLDIEVSLENKLYDLFIYNENIDNAEKLGRDNYVEGKELVDNPYSIDSDQVLNSSWREGYESERLSYESVALIISSGKIEEELRGEVETLKLENKKYVEKSFSLETLKHDLYICINKFCCKLLDRKILSIFYTKDIKKFINNLHKIYYRENPDK